MSMLGLIAGAVVATYLQNESFRNAVDNATKEAINKGIDFLNLPEVEHDNNTTTQTGDN